MRVINLTFFGGVIVMCPRFLFGSSVFRLDGLGVWLIHGEERLVTV